MKKTEIKLTINRATLEPTTNSDLLKMISSEGESGILVAEGGGNYHSARILEQRGLVTISESFEALGSKFYTAKITEAGQRTLQARQGYAQARRK